MKIQNSIPKILSRPCVTKFFFILPLSLSLFLASCDESSVVGLDVQPENDLLNVGYQDTTTVYTRTFLGDSLNTDESLISTGIGLIGKYRDPVFGTTTASMYTQVRIPTNITSTTFGTSPVCDSVILSLVYEGPVYGKFYRKEQKLNVYQLSEDIIQGNVYYSNQTVAKYPSDLTKSNGYVFKPSPLDSVVVLGKKLKPQERIPLDDALGQLILNNQSTGSIANNTLFQSFFKGLYLTTENTVGLHVNEGNIINFRMGESKITVYYHNSNAVNNDSLFYDLPLGSVARFNHFEHDYSAGSIDAALSAQINATPADTNPVVFVQGMAGVQTKITFPFLMNWVDKGLIAINKAELVINLDTTVSTYMLDTFASPSAFVLYGINNDGTYYAIPDAFEGSTYYGGTYNSGTKQYRYNIARYIQQVLDGDRSNTGLFLLTSNGANVANRAVIAGGNAANRAMKLNITYTKLH